MGLRSLFGKFAGRVAQEQAEAVFATAIIIPILFTVVGFGLYIISALSSATLAEQMVVLAYLAPNQNLPEAEAPNLVSHNHTPRLAEAVIEDMGLANASDGDVIASLGAANSVAGQAAQLGDQVMVFPSQATIDAMPWITKIKFKVLEPTTGAELPADSPSAALSVSIGKYVWLWGYEVRAAIACTIPDNLEEGADNSKTPTFKSLNKLAVPTNTDGALWKGKLTFQHGTM